MPFKWLVFRGLGASQNWGGTILGVPIIRTIVFWGLYRGSLILGNYRLGFRGWVLIDVKA